MRATWNDIYDGPDCAVIDVITMMLMYDGGQIFNEKEWHDSYIFDVVRKKLEISDNLKSINISKLGLVDIKNQDHVFVSSILGKFMDQKRYEKKQ